MKLNRAFVTALILCALMSPAVRAGQPQGGGLLARANAAFNQRQEPDKINQAIDLYRRAHQADPTSLQANSQLVRALFWLGDNCGDEKKAKSLFLEAEAAANALVKLHPQHVAGWFLRGACRVLLFSLDHSFSLLDQGKMDLQKALSMDEKFEGGGAHRVLGRLYFRLPWLLGGDNAKAVQHLKKALAMGPKTYNNHLFLAEVLLAQGKKREAEGLLKTLLTARSAPGLEPDLSQLKRRAANLLKSLEQNQNRG